ncbi:transmembrane protein, putative [Medicago truncatula]|uniref:Transmembrane protein, putative n=1 Tax=Medicago truncatula TaxID=3880 RepID=G7LGS6_MEDTR|nr:transmembrane protein, putative [Medicago truncatula]
MARSSSFKIWYLIGTSIWVLVILGGLLHVLESLIFSNVYAQLFVRAWESWSPLKVNVFSCQLLHDRIPIHQNLFSRNIIVDPSGISCVLSIEPIVSVYHIFVGRPLLCQV